MEKSIIEKAIVRENPMPTVPLIREIRKQKAIIARKRNEKMENIININKNK